MGTKGKPVKRGGSRPAVITTTERRTFTLELRKAGVSYRNIVEAAIEHFGREALPKSYDERYACQDVMRWIKQARDDMREDAEDILQLQLQRLDDLMFALWDNAIRGDLKSIDRVLKIMERRAKITGIDKTNLYLEADWRRDAEKQGLSPGDIFEKLVSAYVGHIEEGAVDAEFTNVPVGAIPAEASGGSVAGSATESDTDSESRAEIPKVPENLPE